MKIDRYMTKITKDMLYEAEKDKLERLNLPHKEYERALRDLARRLKI